MYDIYIMVDHDWHIVDHAKTVWEARRLAAEWKRKQVFVKFERRR